jgi:hypothetical protein
VKPLPHFRGIATSRPTPELLEALATFVVEQYSLGRLLREIAELPDRSFSRVRKLLDSRGVRRWPPGAAVHHRSGRRQ